MTYNKKTVRDVELQSRTVLVRVDYNVPLQDGAVADDYRIRKSLETLQYLRERGCKILLCSHLGRPDGQVDPGLSLAPVADRLRELSGAPVTFIPDCIGDQVAVAAKALQPGEVLLLENLRFHPGEQENDRDFARQLADPAEYFVQDAFGTVHDNHASTNAVTEFLPSVMGLLVETEIRQLSVAIDNPVRPLVAIIGGAKISDKIEIIDRFILQANTIIVGGAMANTFLKAQGKDVGMSLYDADDLKEAEKIMEDAHRAGVELVLPTDVGVSIDVSDVAVRRDVSVDAVDDQDKILDYGPESVQHVVSVLKKAGTIIWNGPFGVIELPQFAVASEGIARTIADNHLNCVVGGGDTAGFVHQLGLTDNFAHVSTGGGASLALLAGKELPGIVHLMDVS